MEVEFDDAKFDRLEIDPSFTAGFSGDVVKAYRKRLRIIRNAPDERDFYAMKSLHFEKLKGDRSGEYSMRLNDKWRLTMRFRGAAPGKVVVVIAVEDYH